MASETREERQVKLTSRVAELRARADAKQAQAVRISGTVNDDYAFWTQPAYGNAAGRAFANRRDRERNKLRKAAELFEEARELRAKADAMEARGAVVAGDAAAARQAKIDACKVAVGQMVHTTFYGVRKVLKVNRMTVLVEAGASSLKVEKQFIRPIQSEAA